MAIEILRDMAFPLKKEMFLSKLQNMSLDKWHKEDDFTFKKAYEDYVVSIIKQQDGYEDLYKIRITGNRNNNDHYFAQIAIDNRIDPKSYEIIDKFLLRVLNNKTPEVRKAEEEMTKWITHRGGGTSNNIGDVDDTFSFWDRELH